MENDLLIYKNIAKEVFHEFPKRAIAECKGFMRPPAGTLMALSIFTCLLRSKSAKENETLIENLGWRKILMSPEEFLKIYNQFSDDLDNNLPITVTHFQKMEDLKMRINKFNKEVHNFWDLQYHQNQTLLGHRMTIAIDVIIKIWDLKYSMSFLEK